MSEYARGLYKNLEQAYGKNNMPSESEFINKITTDDKYRSGVYQNLEQAYGKDNMPNIVDFDNKLGVKKKEVTPSSGQQGGSVSPSVSSADNQNTQQKQTTTQISIPTVSEPKRIANPVGTGVLKPNENPIISNKANAILFSLKQGQQTKEEKEATPKYKVGESLGMAEVNLGTEKPSDISQFREIQAKEASEINKQRSDAVSSSTSLQEIKQKLPTTKMNQQSISTLEMVKNNPKIASEVTFNDYVEILEKETGGETLKGQPKESKYELSKEYAKDKSLIESYVGYASDIKKESLKQLENQFGAPMYQIENTLRAYNNQYAESVSKLSNLSSKIAIIQEEINTKGQTEELISEYNKTKEYYNLELVNYESNANKINTLLQNPAYQSYLKSNNNIIDASKQYTSLEETELYKPLFDYKKTEQEKSDESYEKNKLDFWINAPLNLLSEMGGKFTKGAFGLLTTIGGTVASVVPEVGYDIQNALSEADKWVDFQVDSALESTPIPNQLKLPMFQKFAIVDDSKVYLEDNGDVIVVTDQNNKPLPREAQDAVLEKYYPSRNQYGLVENVSVPIGINGTATVLSDMIGAMAMAKKLASTGLVSNTNTALMTSYTAQMYDSFKDEAISAGMNHSDAQKYALGMSAIMSSLETIASPLESRIIKGGFNAFKGRLTTDMVKSIVSGKLSVGQIVKSIAKPIIKETSQELRQETLYEPLVQGLGNMVANTITGSNLDESIALESSELKETITVTLASSLLMSGAQGVRESIFAKGDMLKTALDNPTQFYALMENPESLGINEDRAKEIASSFSKIEKAYTNIKANIPGEVAQTTVIGLYADKLGLESDLSSALTSEQKDKIKLQIESIDNEINKIINNPNNVKKVLEEDSEELQQENESEKISIVREKISKGEDLDIEEEIIYENNKNQIDGYVSKTDTDNSIKIAPKQSTENINNPKKKQRIESLNKERDNILKNNLEDGDYIIDDETKKEYLYTNGVFLNTATEEITDVEFTNGATILKSKPTNLKSKEVTNTETKEPKKWAKIKPQNGRLVVDNKNPTNIISNVKEKSVTIDGLEYQILTDENGSITELVSDNGKKIKTEPLLANVEILRNKLPNTKQETEVSVADIDISPLIDNAMNENITPLVANGIDKALNGERVTDNIKNRVISHINNVKDKLTLLGENNNAIKEKTKEYIDGLNSLIDFVQNGKIEDTITESKQKAEPIAKTEEKVASETTSTKPKETKSEAKVEPKKEDPKEKVVGEAEQTETESDGETESDVNAETERTTPEESGRNTKEKPKEITKPKNKQELADKIRDVFGLSKKKAQAVADIIGLSAKSLVKASVFNSEKEFWDSLPEFSKEKPENISDDQYQSAKGVYSSIKNMIYNLTGGDVSTVLHEVSHWWLDNIDRSANQGNKQAKAMQFTLDNFAKSAEGIRFWKANFGGKFDAKNYKYRQELFARSYERYLYDGVAPTPKLKQIFDDISQWFKEIYASLADIDINISDGMRSLYGKILSYDEVQLVEDDFVQQSESEIRENLSENIKSLDSLNEELSDFDAFDLFQKNNIKNETIGLNLEVLDKISEAYEKGDAVFKRLSQREQYGFAKTDKIGIESAIYLDRLYGANQEGNLNEQGQKEALILFQARQNEIQQAVDNIQKWVDVAKGKNPNIKKSEFIEVLKNNPTTKKIFDFFTEKEVGDIFANTEVDTSLFDEVVNNSQENVTNGTSERRYINRVVQDAESLGFQEYMDEVEKLEGKADRISQEAVEKIAEKLFQSMLNADNIDVAFLAFLNYASTRVFSAKEGSILPTMSAQVFHKIIAYYKQNGDIKNAKRWIELFSGSGRALGQFISAMQESSTPEAIANKITDKIAEENNKALDKVQDGGKTGKEIMESTAETLKTTKEESKNLVDNGKKTNEAKNKAVSKSRPSKKAIKDTELSDTQKKSKESAKAKAKSFFEIAKGEGLFQISGKLKDIAKGVVDDILDMGAKSKEIAFATYSSIMEEQGVPSEIISESFNEVWSADQDAKVKDNMSDYIAEKVVSGSKTKPKKVTEKTNPLDMVANVLIARATEIIPESARQTAKKAIPAIERLAELIKNKEIAESAWRKAMNEVRNQIEVNPMLTDMEKAEMIAQLEDDISNFMSKPLPKSLVRKAIKTGAKDLGVEINKVIQESLESQTETGDTIAKNLIEQLGLDADIAQELQDAVMEDWNDMLSEAKERALEIQLEKDLKKKIRDADLAKKKAERKAELERKRAEREREKAELKAERDRLREIERQNKINEKERKKAEERIKKLVGLINNPKPNTSKGKDLIDDVMEAVNGGVLDDAVLKQAFENQFGLRTLTPEQENKLRNFVKLLSTDLGIEYKGRITRDFADFLKSLEPRTAVAVYEFAEGAIVSMSLSGLVTNTLNIPVGTAAMMSKSYVAKLATSPIGMWNAIQDFAKTNQRGIGWNAGWNALKTGYNQLSDVNEVFSNEPSLKGSLNRYIFNNINERKQKLSDRLEKSKQKENAITRALSMAGNVYIEANIVSLSIFQSVMNLNSFFDPLVSHRLGEYYNYVNLYNLEMENNKQNKLNKTRGEILDSVREKMGYNQIQQDIYAQKAQDIARILSSYGIDISDADIQREAKWQMLASREQEVVEQSYEEVSNASMMGKPYGIFGKILESTQRLTQYNRNPESKSDYIANAFKFAARVNLMLFSRVATMSLNTAIKAIPLLGALNSFYTYKPNKNGKWDFQLNSKEEIRRNLIGDAAILATYVGLLAHMFDWDDEEETFVLNPNRLIDMTLDVGAITKDYKRGDLEEDYTPLAIRVRTSPNKDFSRWQGIKYGLPIIPIVAMLGGLSDRINYKTSDKDYKEEQGDDLTKPSIKKKIAKKDLLINAYPDVARALGQLSFNQTLRTIGDIFTAINPSTSADTRERKFTDIVANTSKPYKQLVVPFTSNISRDIINITASYLDVEQPKYTKVEKIFWNGFALADFAASASRSENRVLRDRFGNKLPRQTALHQLAYAVNTLPFIDIENEGIADLQKKTIYQIINTHEGMAVPKEISISSTNFGKILKNRDTPENLKIQVEDLMATEWGNRIEKEYGNGSWRKKSEEEIYAKLYQLRTKSREYFEELGYRKVNGERVKLHINLYDYHRDLYLEIFPEYK